MKKTYTIPFTLIELLAIISIIIMLMSILLPVLNDMKEQAKQKSCLNSMMQIGTAFAFYANDNNAHLPPVVDYDGTKLLNWWDTSRIWSIIETEEYNFSLWRESIFFCETAANQLPNTVSAHMAMNSAAIDNSPFTSKKITKYDSPSETLLLGEGTGKHIKSQSLTGQWGLEIIFPHIETSNIIHLDNRGASLTRDEYPNTPSDIFWKGN